MELYEWHWRFSLAWFWFWFWERASIRKAKHSYTGIYLRMNENHKHDGSMKRKCDRYGSFDLNSLSKART
jgi:hypothetical protein